MLRLNIGCGLDLRDGYINIDSETKESILKRYANSDNEIFISYLEKNIEVFNYDIFNLPYDDATVDEITCNAFLEHLDFVQERRFFFEISRVMKIGGEFHFSVPDFEWTIKKWLGAKDEWQDFYYTDKGEHYFGQYNRNMNNRWGYLTTTIFGNQGSEGQYHKNAFTRNKIEAILKRIKFDIRKFEEGYYRDKFEKVFMVSSVKIK